MTPDMFDKIANDQAMEADREEADAEKRLAEAEQQVQTAQLRVDSAQKDSSLAAIQPGSVMAKVRAAELRNRGASAAEMAAAELAMSRRMAELELTREAFRRAKEARLAALEAQRLAKELSEQDWATMSPEERARLQARFAAAARARDDALAAAAAAKKAELEARMQENERELAKKRANELLAFASKAKLQQDAEAEARRNARNKKSDSSADARLAQARADAQRILASQTIEQNFADEEARQKKIAELQQQMRAGTTANSDLQVIDMRYNELLNRIQSSGLASEEDEQELQRLRTERNEVLQRVNAEADKLEALRHELALLRIYQQEFDQWVESNELARQRRRQSHDDDMKKIQAERDAAIAKNKEIEAMKRKLAIQVGKYVT